MDYFPEVKPTGTDPDGVEFWELSNGDWLYVRDGEIFSPGVTPEDPDSLEYDALIMLTIATKARREANLKRGRP